jgi:Asp-tRNA(Asn)/Glu-tRNA(Gln) amidotransferase A subunit family amidase
VKFTEYLKRDAVALAECVARKETTAEELLDLALRQSERAQPKTNAICRSMDEEARAQLTKPLQGPLAGVPFLIKDCAQDYAGLPTSYASRSLAGVAPSEHAHVVRRYLEAGLVILARPTCRNWRSRLSPTRNCSDAPRIPGISSTHPAARAAALPPPLHQASCRWRRAMTAAARSAFLPHAAGFSA